MSIGPLSMLLQDSLPRVARLLGKQRRHVPRLHVPVVAERVGDLAFQQKAVGEQLVRRHAGQGDVFDRVAKRPVAQVVQQGRGDERLAVLRPHGGGEPLVAASCLRYSSALR